MKIDPGLKQVNLPAAAERMAPAQTKTLVVQSGLAGLYDQAGQSVAARPSKPLTAA